MIRRSAMAAALVLALSGAGGAGEKGGPKGGSHIVGGERTHWFEMTFEGSESALIIVSGDGDTDLDLYVYDEFGNEVASDNDWTDQCLVSWTPIWTGKFTIKVVNRGGRANLYRLRTN